jgi:beta-phosphoglucomutase family hydrolase
VEPGLSLIFDMDGVIWDSNPVHREAWTAYNRSFGIATTEAMHQRMYGKRNDEIIRDFFGPDLTIQEVARRGAEKEQLYRRMVDGRAEQILVPGIREFLAAHRSAPVALATNAEPENVAFLLDKTDLGGFFRVIVSGDQVERPKPHPEIYLRTAALLGLAPENAIVFEDSLTGVEAALAAGARVVGLLTTHANLPGASLCIDNFRSEELVAWLDAQRRLV